MHDFPPTTLYATICTPAAYAKRPGSPTWQYDGQFIWMPKSPVQYGFSKGMKPYPPGSVGAEMFKQYKKRIGL